MGNKNVPFKTADEYREDLAEALYAFHHFSFSYYRYAFTTREDSIALLKAELERVKK